MALSHHIDTLRSKPEHVRERIAFMTSAGITGVVAAVWLVTLVATGTFTLTPADSGTLASAGSSVTQATQQTQSNFSQLVGAANAALGATTSAPDLRIVDGGSSSSLDDADAAAAASANATVIPF